MTYSILADTAASVTELKSNPIKVVAQGNGLPVAVLNRNTPAFYCVPASAFEAMMELLDDAHLLSMVKERMSEASIKVELDAL